MQRTVVLCAVFFLVLPLTHGQFADNQYLSRDQLTEDLEELRTTILDSHTDPFGYCTEQEFHEAFDHAISALPDSALRGTFARTVAGVLNVMKDSHSCLDYGSLMQYQFSNGGYVLPIRFHSDDDGLRVEKDLANKIPPGSKVQSINGYNADSLWQIAYQYACIEGDALTGRQRVADAILPFILGLHAEIGKSVTIDALPFGKDTLHRYINYRTDDLRRSRQRRKELLRTGEGSDVELSYPEKGVALLRVSTFAPSLPRKYKKQIFRSFNSFRNSQIETLVIDIRNNSGGSSTWVEYLYSFLDKKGYNTPSNIIGRNTVLARERVPAFSRKFSRFMLRYVFPNNEDIQGFVKLFNGPEGRNDTLYFAKPQLQKDKVVFTGKCYLLMNGLTASAGVDFSNAFKSRNRGIIVGESCLGPQGGTWGNPAPYQMKHSGIRLFISTIRYNYNSSFYYDPTPLQPDAEIKVTGKNLSEGEDSYLQYILDQLAPSNP